MEKILIVDDDKNMQDILSDIIKGEGYEVSLAGDGRKALREFKANSPAVVLLDVMLPEIDGMKVLEEIKKTGDDTAVIMLTADGQLKDAVKAMKLGAFDYVVKPFNNDEIVSTIKKALQSGCKVDLTAFKGESAPIKQVLNNVAVVAPTNMTVVLQGETGTGKELIAKMIHRSSLRHNKPFVVVDGGTLSENLIESELFGYEKGAFTGAYERKAGKLEAADGGTLFLDEITNLPHTLQSKLLRGIQERSVRRLGGTREIKLDVRIIAATNTVLSDEVKKGRFRYDLFQRLNEFSIELPPLRKRKEDIPLLANYFLAEANQEFKKKIEGISGEAMKALLSYDWPGNVRELRNTVKRAALLTYSDTVREICFQDSEGLSSQIDMDKGLSLVEIVRKTTEIVEKKVIGKVLAEANNNKTRAARILKIDRVTLYSKMKYLGL